jgi:hypothetical protein
MAWPLLYTYPESDRQIRRNIMKSLITMFDAIWISAAFAEAGEQETARTFMGPELCESESVVVCQAL